MSKGTKRANRVITTNRDVLIQALANEKLLLKILQNQKTIMASIKDLTAQVDELQAAVDAEQQEVATRDAAMQKSIDDLNKIIADLQANIQDGGTVEERQALSDKIAAVKTDLENTVTPEEPAEENPA